MHKRLMATLFAVVLMIVGLAACGSSDNTEISTGRPCAEVRKDLKQAKDDKTEQAGTPAEAKMAKAVKDLETELKSCDDGSKDKADTTTTAVDESPPPDDGKAGVADSDGELRSLALVDGEGPVIKGDSTNDPRTPASYELAKENGPLVTWSDAERELGKLDWYVKAVNARKSKTGFDWSDVSKWATTTYIDPRVIHVFNMDVTDQGARDAVRNLVGSDANRMPIARHNTCIVNTRGFGHETVQDFADCRKMVRVSLAPIVYDEKGEPVGLRSNAGIFVDCLNIWWIPRQVVKNGPPPQKAPPAISTPPGTIPPGTVPPTTRPPGTTTTTTRPGTTTTTTRPTVTTTTRPAGKDSSQSPVTDDENDPDEPTRPRTTEPPRAPPATPAPTTQPRVPTPTTQAPYTSAPATTTPATVPTDGCPDEGGYGICD